jgi:hypothetical protein
VLLAIVYGERSQSYADTPIGSYLPGRYEPYYDGRFARDWAATVAVVGWKLPQPGEVRLACVAEELALFALIRQAQVLLDLREEENDEQAGRRWCNPALWQSGFARPRRRLRYTVRRASVGESRAARIAGRSPAVPPMRMAAARPPAQALAGTTAVQCLRWA